MIHVFTVAVFSQAFSGAYNSFPLFHSVGFVRSFGFAMEADLGKFHVEMQRALHKAPSSLAAEPQIVLTCAPIVLTRPSILLTARQ